MRGILHANTLHKKPVTLYEGYSLSGEFQPGKAGEVLDGAIFVGDTSVGIRRQRNPDGSVDRVDVIVLPIGEGSGEV